MRHFPALFLTFALLVTAVLTACGGGNGTPVFGNPASITVSPTNTSIRFGTVENLNAIVLDSKGTALFNSAALTASSNVTFTSSNPAVLDIANNGLMCAGKWDNVAAPVVCATTGVAGQSAITVKSGTITSTPVTIFVHAPVDRIDISGSPLTPDTCISQSATAQLTAKAFSGGTDVTSTVGPVTFTPAIPDVVTVDANGLATAGDPGQSNVVADIGDFRSSPVQFVTCPVVRINVHVKGATDTSSTLEVAGTATLTADLKDKNGTNVIISKQASTTTASLTWSTTSPAATVTPVSVVRTDVTASTSNDATLTASRAGSSGIVASCTPPLCNAGLSPAYSNVFTEKTNGSTTSTVFVTGTDTTALIPIPTSSNTPGTAITLSNQPNSLLIGPDGARAFLGSAGGLMVVDANALSLTTTVAAVTGKVLAVAQDGKTVVVSDPTKSVVFVGDATTGAFQVFPFAGVTSAAYSRDGFRLYLASPDAVNVVTTNGSIKNFSTLGATDVATHASGSLAYFASGSVAVIASCNLSRLSDATGASGTAKLIRALPDGSQMLAAGVNTLDAISATADNTACPPNVSDAATQIAVTGTPSQIIVTSDGSRAFITNNTSNIVAYKASDKSVSTIPLTGSPVASFTGGVTLDGAQLYVGVQGAANTSPVVHRIDLATNTDAQQVTAGTTSFTPNLVAVKP